MPCTWLLIETGIAKGRRMTSFNSIKTDVANAGAHWEDSEVVVDQGLITSRNPGHLEAFSAKIVEEEGRPPHRTKHGLFMKSQRYQTTGICVVVFDSGEEAFTALRKLANNSGSRRQRSRTRRSAGFDFDNKTHEKIKVGEECEVLSAIGDIALGDDGNLSRTVWITFQDLGTTSSVSVMSSPSLDNLADPQQRQLSGAAISLGPHRIPLLPASKQASASKIHPL
jgi:hypothetical protein